ncbi:hypothetical protein [Dyadobacter sp. CY312]|uniref:hypothetical protein n=1 Tax=Dyadobacter sp. CY312 TaxID=2907303 RepID=UPI001F2B800D|nr:hypothetical protein [Dyadobacter sp. CY312]MCE7044211.1 hypothetical protein [Dyadobacter sp. CY312]
MVSGILGVFSALFLFARKAVKNEPMKNRIENMADNLNGYLALFKDNRPSLMTMALGRFLQKIAVYSLVLAGICMVTLPNEAHATLSSFFSAIFVTCMTLYLAIQWNQNHRATIKNSYKDVALILLLLAPGMVYIFDLVFKTGFSNIIFEKFGYTLGINGLWSIQFFWAVFTILLMYIGFWVISVPVFLFLYSIIFVFSLLIKTSYKHVDTNIADGLSAVLVVMITVMKLLGW